MKQIHELKFTMKYTGKELDLGTEHLYPKVYDGYNMGDIRLSAEFVADVIGFSETIQDFEARYKENAFTKRLDAEPHLTQLFLYMLNAYTEKDNLDGYCYDFREWVIESLEEIQELIDDGEYEVCDYCQSIVPKEETVTINGDFYEGRTVCFECSVLINRNRK